MIRIASQPKPATPAWHEVFLKMAPAIETHARLSFRHLPPEARAELIQNALCSACAAVARLAELNKLDLCYPSVLARFAVAQTKIGRVLGRRLNCKDVASEYCQRVKGIVVKRLDRYDHEEEVWEEILIPDRTCTPAELAASRIDFPAWLKTLSSRDRKVALALAAGETTGRTARKFHLVPGRVSQIRRQLCEAWRKFQGENLAPATAAVPAQRQSARGSAIWPDTKPRPSVTAKGPVSENGIPDIVSLAASFPLPVSAPTSGQIAEPRYQVNARRIRLGNESLLASSPVTRHHATPRIAMTRLSHITQHNAVARGTESGRPLCLGPSRSSIGTARWAQSEASG
jgi:hypothetical protein